MTKEEIGKKLRAGKNFHVSSKEVRKYILTVKAAFGVNITTQFDYDVGGYKIIFLNGK